MFCFVCFVLFFVIVIVVVVVVCFVLFCFDLFLFCFCFRFFFLFLFSFVLFCFVLFCFVLFCLVLIRNLDTVDEVAVRDPLNVSARHGVLREIVVLSAMFLIHIYADPPYLSTCQLQPRDTTFRIIQQGSYYTFSY